MAIKSSPRSKYISSTSMSASIYSKWPRSLIKNANDCSGMFPSRLQEMFRQHDKMGENPRSPQQWDEAPAEPGSKLPEVEGSLCRGKDWDTADDQLPLCDCSNKDEAPQWAEIEMSRNTGNNPDASVSVRIIQNINTPCDMVQGDSWPGLQLFSEPNSRLFLLFVGSTCWI